MQWHISAHYSAKASVTAKLKLCFDSDWLETYSSWMLFQAQHSDISDLHILCGGKNLSVFVTLLIYTKPKGENKRPNDGEMWFWLLFIKFL